MKPSLANCILLLAGAIWGLGFIAQQTAMDDVDPMLFIGLRFTLAGFAVLPLALRELGRTPRNGTRSELTHYAGLGTVFFAGMALQQIGLMGTTVTNAGFLTTLYVVIVPLLSLLVLRQSQSATIWISAVTSLAGVYLLSQGGIGDFAWGDRWILACALVWAIHVLLTGVIARRSCRPIGMACTQFFVCGMLGIAGFVISWFFASHTHAISWLALQSAAPEIIYAGIFSGGLAFTLQVIGQKYTSASVAAILMASESLFAALLGAWLLDERLRPEGYLGCFLIFAAILAVQARQPAERVQTKTVTP